MDGTRAARRDRRRAGGGEVALLSRAVIEIPSVAPASSAVAALPSQPVSPVRQSFGRMVDPEDETMVNSAPTAWPSYWACSVYVPTAVSWYSRTKLPSGCSCTQVSTHATGPIGTSTIPITAALDAFVVYRTVLGLWFSPF